jgi:hypothetical protein
MDEEPASTHDLSVLWSSSSLRRWHPRSSVPLVLTSHSLPILNKQSTRVINLSIFLLCYSLIITTLRSWALHWVLFRWFNVPDALICYPGSIEKLKLLGATYLPTCCCLLHVWSSSDIAYVLAFICLCSCILDADLNHVLSCMYLTLHSCSFYNLTLAEIMFPFVWVLLWIAICPRTLSTSSYTLLMFTISQASR